MWKCLYAYKVVGRALPYIGLYKHTQTGTRRVVRIKEIVKASAYSGEDSDKFQSIPATRPDVVFRNMYAAEGDIAATLQVIEGSGEPVPDLLPDALRDKLSKDSLDS